MQYKVEGGKCTRSPLTGSIPTFGVPSDASYYTSEFIGAELPKLGVLVNEYDNIDADKKTVYLSSYAPVDGTVCVPVLITNLAATPTLQLQLTL